MINLTHDHIEELTRRDRDPLQPVRDERSRILPRQADILIKKRTELEFNGKVVNTPYGRSDPIRELARFDHAPHERTNEFVVILRRKPVSRLAFPSFLGKKHSIRANVNSPAKASYLAVKSHVRKRHPEWDPEPLGNSVPAVHTGLNFTGVVVAASAHSEPLGRANLPVHHRAVFDFLNRGRNRSRAE